MPDSTFAQLDKLAMELGDPTASNELVLKIAHQMIEGVKLSDLGDEELDSRLSDALRSKTYGSQRMDEYISDMLDEVRARKMFLTEESEANLADRLAVPATARLADSGEQYNIYRFSTLSVEEAAKMLTHMSKDIFARYSQTLAKKRQGGSRFWIATMQSTHCLAKRSHGRRFPHCWMKPVLCHAEQRP